MGLSIRKIALLLVAVAVIGASAVPIAVAGAGGDVAVAAAKKKCKKKPGAKKKKCKKRGGSSSPGLPGSPLSPTPPAGSTPPAEPPAPAEPTVDGLTVDDDPVLGGTSTSGQMTISDPAPSGGRAVSLQSSSPTRVSVPSSVHVAAGQTTAGFPVTTTDGPTVTATITASIGSSSRNVQLTAVADPSLTSLKLVYQCFPGIGLVNVGGNRVTLDVPAPSDTPVSLQSSDPSSLAVPPAVIVPDGASSALFGVDTVEANPSVTVTATLGSSTANDTASVRDGSSPAPVVTGLTLNPDTIPSDGTSTGTVTLNCEALAGGATVTLSSDNLEVPVPPSGNVVVAQSSLTADFLIDPVAGAMPGTATITANTGLEDQRQAILTIEDFGT